MGIPRTDAAGVEPRIQVSRTGRSTPVLRREHLALPLDQILLGDCVAELSKLPDSSVDLVFADPPYNLQLDGELTRPDQSLVDAVDDDWDKFASFADYDHFTRAWLLAARRVMKPNATLWVIGSYHNIFRVGAILQDLGFWILNDIVWRKANPMPNFRGRRFTNAHETLIWAARGPAAKRYTFNYDALKAGNEDLQVRSDWLIPLCTGGERLKDEDGRKAASDAEARGAARPRACCRRPTPGDVVLDPFFGTGTTGAVARRSAASSSASSATLSTPRRRMQRIAAVDAAGSVDDHGARPRSAASRASPSLSVVEAGLHRSRHDPHRREAPASGHGPRRRRAHASAIWSGSIHKVGALVQGLPACNGWTFWHIEDRGGLPPIDMFRKPCASRWPTRRSAAARQRRRLASRATAPARARSPCA